MPSVILWFSKTTVVAPRKSERYRQYFLHSVSDALETISDQSRRSYRNLRSASILNQWFFFFLNLYLLSNSLLFSIYICRPHYNIRSRNVFAFENGNDEHLVFLLLSVVYSVGKECSSCIDGWFVYWRTRLKPIYRNNKVKPMELGLKMQRIL